MRKNRKLTPLQKNRILDLRYNGLSVSLIHEQTGHSKTTIDNLLIKMSERKPDYIGNREKASPKINCKDIDIDNKGRLAEAVRILKTNNIYAVINDRKTIRGKIATLADIMREANKILKTDGMSQIQGSSEWII